MTAEEWLYGLNAVKAALSRSDNLIRTLWVLQGRKDKRMQEILDLAECKNINVHKGTSRAGY